MSFTNRTVLLRFVHPLLFTGSCWIDSVRLTTSDNISLPPLTNPLPSRRNCAPLFQQLA